MTLEGRKISTSQNWAIWLKDIVDCYHPDSLHYFLISNGPEKRDTDFTWNEYVNSHNGELLGAYGNLVNRVLIFIQKYFGGKMPAGILEKEIEVKIEDLYVSTGELIEEGNLKEVLSAIFEFVRLANKYFDTQQPWIMRIADDKACENTLYNCVQILTNLTALLAPFLPFSSDKIKKWLGIDLSWKVKNFRKEQLLLSRKFYLKD